MKREAKEEGWLNPKKRFKKKNEAKSQKIWKKVIRSPKKWEEDEEGWKK